MYGYGMPVRTEIIHVTGENGAKAFNMFPNSSALLLDDTAPVIWLAQTDGAGYKQLTAYEIKPVESHEDALEARIQRLEKIINESYSSKTDTE